VRFSSATNFDDIAMGNVSLNRDERQLPHFSRKPRARNGAPFSKLAAHGSQLIALKEAPKEKS